jgi:hypothetical protein
MPTTSTEPPKVYGAICAVMADIGKTGIAKDRKNVQQNYAFRGIDDVYNELNGLLAKHRLVMLPAVAEAKRTERETKNGGVLFYTQLTVDFTLASAEDGSTTTIRTVGEAMDSADKSSNKAQSAAYKYAAMMVFCIPTEGDNDADATTHEVRAGIAATANGRKSSAQAKRDGDDAKVKADIAKCDKDGVRDWHANFDSYTAHLPLSWLDSVRDMLEARLEELNGEERVAGDAAELDAGFRGTVAGSGAGRVAGRTDHGARAA